METIWAKHMMANVPCQASGERLPILRRIGIKRFIRLFGLGLFIGCRAGRFSMAIYRWRLLFRKAGRNRRLKPHIPQGAPRPVGRRGRARV
jgi:hypothetical protein